MKKFSIGIVIFCSLAMIGCVSTGKIPQDLRYTLHKDLSYGPHERNVVDISLPQGASQGLILFIHGGIWMYGDKDNCPIFLDTFRDRFVVASMSHRYIDETTHIKDLEEDVAAAILYIQEFCLRNRAAPAKLILMGHSSGAHLAMLYAYKQHEPRPIPIAFCVDMAGPTDLSDTSYLYNFKKLLKWDKFFYQLAEKTTGHRVMEGDITSEGYSESSLKIMEAISPLYFVTASSPPTIIVHDVADKLVPYSNSTALNSAFNVYGIDHDFLALYSGIGHFLGAKAFKGGALRYDKTMADWLVRVMNEYIAKYCGDAAVNPGDES